jgi:hypothetical protein
MTRTLALIAALTFGVSSAAFAAGDCGSYQVSTSKTTVASADGQSVPSTQTKLPRQKGG